MNCFKNSLSIGISFIILGILLIAASINKADKGLIKRSLLKKIFGDKINGLISFITNIAFIFLGVALIIFDYALNSPITIGLFFILIGVKSMTGEFSGRKGDFLEERFSEKTIFLMSLITSVVIISIGIGIIVWHSLIKKG